MPCLPDPRPRALELFAGIGGLRLAAEPYFAVAGAWDQDRTAARVYEANHGDPVRTIDLASVRAGELCAAGASVWLLSPPCQPFTRRGRGRDVDDPRARGLLRLIELLPACRPRRVLVENVVGFVGSRAHARLVAALGALGHEVRDLAVCPSELGDPVRRPRELVLASADGLGGDPEVPGPPPARRPLAGYLDPEAEQDPGLRIDPALLERYPVRVDPADPDALVPTFTRSYGHARTGAGPILADPRGARFFSPGEILRLHGFPASFRFPPGLTLARRFRLAGNGVHVGSIRRGAALLVGRGAEAR